MLPKHIPTCTLSTHRIQPASSPSSMDRVNAIPFQTTGCCLQTGALKSKSPAVASLLPAILQPFLLQVCTPSCSRAGQQCQNERNFTFWMLTLVTIARQCCQWRGRKNCCSQLCCSQSGGFCVAPNGYGASSLLWPRTG